MLADRPDARHGTIRITIVVMPPLFGESTTSLDKIRSSFPFSRRCFTVLVILEAQREYRRGVAKLL